MSARVDLATQPVRKQRTRNIGVDYIISFETGDRLVSVTEPRVVQTLDLLIARMNRGLTSMESPGVRLSSYVHKARGLGVPIRTDHEKHGGKYAGTHANYKLAAEVRRAREAA
jgi:hypothetical protein